MLENALARGKIIANTNYNSNIFTISKDELETLLNDWGDSYPELKKVLSRWKFGSFDDDDDIRTNKTFKSEIFERGKDIFFIFLGIRPKSNGNKLQCFELTANCKFEAPQLQSGLEGIGLYGRTVLAIGSLG
ncbi:17854_t:CDS:1, partial [Racocetra fulgida]